MDALKRAFHDIASGYTRGVIVGKPAYVKHLSYSDQMDHDAKRDEFYQEARTQGLATAEERLGQLRKEGKWTEQMEKDVVLSKQMIEGMVQGKKDNMKMPSLVKRYNEQIKEEEKKLTGLLLAKDSMLGLTCESYSERQISDHYIWSNLFASKELNHPLFTQEEFDYLSPEEVSTVAKDYNQVIEICSEQSIKRLAIQGFFQNYFGLVGDNLGQFFGKPICSLTFFQVRLLGYGAHFRAIYQQHEVQKWPKNVQEDPDMLSDYATAAARGKQEMDKQGASDPDTVVVGMKQEDSKALGITSQNNLAAQVAKSGGNLIDHLMRQAR